MQGEATVETNRERHEDLAGFIRGDQRITRKAGCEKMIVAWRTNSTAGNTDGYRTATLGRSHTLQKLPQSGLPHASKWFWDYSLSCRYTPFNLKNTECITAVVICAARRGRPGVTANGGRTGRLHNRTLVAATLTLHRAGRCDSSDEVSAVMKVWLASSARDSSRFHARVFIQY